MKALSFFIWTALMVCMGCAIVFPSEEEKDSGRVVIGTTTDMRGWEFIASIQETTGDRIGVGLLISPKNALTTCGCVKSIIYDDVSQLPGPGINFTELVAGTVDVTQKSQGMWRKASKLIEHPHCSNRSIYFPMSGHTFDYGIVQVHYGMGVSLRMSLYLRGHITTRQVNESFNFIDGEIVRLRLPTWDPHAFEGVILNELLIKRTCLVAGWGYTVITFPSRYLEPSNVLLTTEVQLEEWMECAEAVCSKHEPHCFSAVLLTGKLCANPIGKGNPCKGDIGAPLVCNGFVIAIFSTLRSCGEYNEPNYYARLDIVLPWILEFADRHNEATPGARLSWAFLPTFLVVLGSRFKTTE